MIRLEPGLRQGAMRLPLSKSHAHRVLIADFLAGGTRFSEASSLDCDDLLATKRCLMRLDEARRRIAAGGPIELPVGESGTTRRLLGPVVAALGFSPDWRMEGRLMKRPQIDYTRLLPGVHELPGNVSSQFVSGLLLALPLLAGDSEIRLSSPLASRGYVDMTRDVLSRYGVRVTENPAGFLVPAQKYILPAQAVEIESDWSGAAFPLAMNALGNAVAFSCAGLSEDSRQPDRAVRGILARLTTGESSSVDVDACPDLFPVLAVVAAAQPCETRFTGIGRLRLKESDRLAAMADVLTRFGVAVRVTDDAFVVGGRASPFKGGDFTAFSDHRIAMSIAVGATRASSAVTIDNAACAAKSYPIFFEDFSNLTPLI